MSIREARCREKLSYNPETGDLIWGEKAYCRLRGKKAGTKHSHGYLALCINIDGRTKRLYAHRVAWLLQYGEWPPEGMQIDHINGDPADNRIANLRLATRSQNMANVRQPRHSSSPYKGVTYHPKAGPSKTWKAQIKLDGKRKHLGLYATPEEAHEAYKAAAIKYFGEFARFK